MAAKVFSKGQAIPERSTRLYSSTLTDLLGQTLTAPQMVSIKFSLRDDKTDYIVNARNRVEVLNANGGTFLNGVFSMVFSSADTVTTSKSKYQKRRALFEIQYQTGLENHEVYFYIQNLEDIPSMVEMAFGGLSAFGLRPTVVVV